MTRGDPVLGERVARHGFADRPAADAAEAAARICGIQAQDGFAARLAVRSRSAIATDADVTRAIDDRAAVRTWLMRNTIHLVPARDVRWMTALLGPMIRRRFETVRWPGLGLTPRVLAAAEAVTSEILAGTALSRAEFASALRDRGVPIEASGQAPTHVLLYLTTVGLVCRASDRGRSATFALLDDWIPDEPAGPRGDDALAELARRYFAAYSPATAADFTTWSGLPGSRAVTLIRGELDAVDIGGRRGFRAGEVEPAAGLRLLAGFENYLIGYRDRTAIIADDRRGEIYAGGLIRPAVLLDGRVVGRWRLDETRGASTVEVTCFETLPRRARTALDEEVADVGRFLGRTCALELT